MTKIFNEFDVQEGIDFLSVLPEAKKDKFIKDIRQQAVKDFWWHEREAILNGTCTRDWTPEQIENIMAISEKIGKMGANAGKGLQIDENGIFLVDKKGNKSYYGHHMVDVSTHPEYAGDWRNVQALTYDEHYYGAHPNHDTKTPTEGYYNFETGKTEVIDVTADGFSFDNTEYPPKQKCIFKSDEAMKTKYSNYDTLSDGEKLALKNADLALESGDVGKFNSAKDLAEKYNSKDFFDKIGLNSEYDIKNKYKLLSECNNADIISEYQFYEYASQHGYDIDMKVYVDENGKVVATSLDKDYVPKETDYKISKEESLTLSEEKMKQQIAEMKVKDSQVGTDSGRDQANNVTDGREEIKDANSKKENVEEVKGADRTEDGKKAKDSDIEIVKSRHVHLGKNVYVNFNSTFVDDAQIYIGDGAMLAPNVTIIAASHPISPKLRVEGYGCNKPVNIGKNVWIASNVTILPGVHIGDNSVIGAGSVVTKDVPENVFAAGNPAKIIREITEEDDIYYDHGKLISKNIV